MILFLAPLFAKFSVVARLLTVVVLWFTYRMADRDNDRIRGWVRSAHARRKRVERILRKEQAKNAKLIEENESLSKRNSHLAAELAQEILTNQDRETVKAGLTRKL